MRSSLVALILAAAPVAADPGLQQTSMVVWKWPEPYFEAWSAIEVIEAGASFIAIGDYGQSYCGHFEREGDRIMGVSREPLGALTDTDGAAFFRKSGENISDSEDLTTLPDGRFAVTFDRSSKILVYGDDSNPKRIDLPPNVNALTENRGVEALALDLEGRLIAIPEPVPRQAPGVPV